MLFTSSGVSSSKSLVGVSAGGTGRGFRTVLASTISDPSDAEWCSILEVITSLPVQMLCRAGISSLVVAEIGTVSKVAVVLVSRLKVGFCELKSHGNSLRIFPVEPPDVMCLAQ